MFFQFTYSSKGVFILNIIRLKYHFFKYDICTYIIKYLTFRWTFYELYSCKWGFIFIFFTFHWWIRFDNEMPSFQIKFDFERFAHCTWCGRFDLYKKCLILFQFALWVPWDFIMHDWILLRFITENRQQILTYCWWPWGIIHKLRWQKSSFCNNISSLD